jgi:solute carrier family 36 (proton-coupled amino acid transporter)
MGILCVHCMHMLLSCYRYANDKIDPNNPSSTNLSGYEQVTKEILKEKYGIKKSKTGKLIISMLLIISQLGFCTVYYVFIPINIKQVIDYYQPENQFTIEIYMAILLAPLILFCFIKNLKILAPFSTLANVLMILGMCVIMYELVTGEKKPWKDLVMIAEPKTWAIFYSTAIYAFEGIGLVLPLYSEMRNKRAFSSSYGVLNTGMALVTIMYFSIGFYGYLKYGHDVAASITLNLNVEKISFQFLKISFSLAIFISYNLQFYVAASILWTYMYKNVNYLKQLKDRPNKLFKFFEYLFRSLIVCFTFLLAFFIPRIDLFISLVGAISGSMLALVIPPILDLIVFLPTAKYPKIKIAKNILISLFGVYIFIAGTYVSISDIINYFRNKN